MQTLWAREPSARERTAESERNGQATPKSATLAMASEASEASGSDSRQERREEQEQEQMTTLSSLMETPAEDEATNSANPTDDAFGFSFASLPGPQSEELYDSPQQQQLDSEWRRDNGPQESVHAREGQSAASSDDKKAEEGRVAEHSQSLAPLPSLSPSKLDKREATHDEQMPQEPESTARTAGKARRERAPRKTAKPAITINTGASGVGNKRPPPTPVSPPSFSWNDILRVQNLIERCLQQYLSKSEILVALKGQANVDPGFANVVWQKLEEQNPSFFRAYNLQLQLKEQIIAFNYLVGQQKEMAAKGDKRHLHYRTSGSRPAASCSLATTPTTTTLPPISMDSRTFLRAPPRPTKQQRTPAGKRAFNQHQHMNVYQLGSPSVSLGPPPSPLPLPSPIKTDLDTHAFFT
ncbi:hypothetical protein BBJ28_00009817 [Nothophytophthora sp. Chile5]|nr:hypothetical protein BBJ28_00009817 [Nothophytophthora sp. Chile5]